MIIVEGMDNSGKSTLVRKLSKDLKLLAINNQQRPQKARDIIDYLHMIMDASHRFPIVMDRLSVISEPIYGPIIRGSHLLNTWQLHTLTYQLKARKPTIVYCRPPRDVVLGFRGEQMEGVVEHGDALLDAYDLSISQLRLGGFSVLNYDWTTDSYDQLKDELDE